VEFVIDELRLAWAQPATRRGTLGTALLFAGSLTPAYLPQNSPWWEPLRALGWDTWEARAVGTALVVAGVGLLVHSWFALRPSYPVKLKYWAVGVFWALPLLFAPPVFSHDAYGYAAEGWLLHNDMNPYDFAVSTLPGPFADQVAWLWRYDTAMYPPLSLRIFHLAVLAGGLNPYYATLMLRIPALAGVGLLAYFLPRLAKHSGADVRRTCWFATVNPVLLIDFIGGMHNDALMVGLIVFALWLAAALPDRFGGSKWRSAAAFLVPAVVVGVAAAVKQPAFLAALAVALIGHGVASLRWRDVWPGLCRIVGALAVSAATFAAITEASGLGYGWVKAASVPGKVVTLAPVSLIGNGLRAGLAYLGQAEAGEIALQATQAVGLLVFAVFVVHCGLTVGRTQPVTFLSRSYLAFAFTGPAMHPWYLTWGGLLLPLSNPGPRTERAAIIFTAALTAYGAGNLAWRNEALPLGFAALGLVGGLLWRHLSENRSTAARQPGIE
jgi:alpha-1,6-mannosyltransferase